MATNVLEEQQHAKIVHENVKSIEMSSQIQKNNETHRSSKQMANIAPENNSMSELFIKMLNQ